ncbi:hypothetical protein SDIAM26S_05695 [Streptomyces diastaticus subsp. diastaticus]
MKRSGILNAELSGALATLGRTDLLLHHHHYHTRPPPRGPSPWPWPRTCPTCAPWPSH